MSGKNVVEFLGSEEVFESYGTDVRLKEIMENGKSDIETVANMGQYLLKKFMDQNEEINSLRSNLSERNQEMEHLKERQKYLKLIEETYQEAISERVLELENLKRSTHDHQKKLRRLQREVVRSNETETSQRKSIFELAKSQKGCTFQLETFKHFPIRDYCLLCLNRKDQSKDHKKETGDQFQQVTLVQNNCARLEQDVQNENDQKKILTEKLLALRKEADALTQYLQWSTKVNQNLKSDDPGEMSEEPLEIGNNCDDRSTQKIQECQAVEGDEDVKNDKDDDDDDEGEEGTQVLVVSSEDGQDIELGNNDNTNMHCSLCVVDGMCHQCKAALDSSPWRIQKLFTAIIAFLCSLMKK